MRFTRHVILSASTVTLLACSPAKDAQLHGYAEGEFVRVAAPFAGQLIALPVQRGTLINANQALFALEQANEQAARLEAEARLKSSEAQLSNVQKGRRPSEIAAIRAQIAEADAALMLSRHQLQRDQDLAAKNFISQQRLDETRSALARNAARVNELTAQLETARLGARSDEIDAARSAIKAAQAAVTQAQWRVDQKSIKAPVSGLVHDTLYVVGEWVPAGSPVVSLLPPGNIKVRFFIPQPSLPKFKVGQRVRITCDGCAKFDATVSYVATQAEYTPPVIYSQDARAKLVYLAEARLAPDAAVNLHPGQPIDISLP